MIKRGSEITGNVTAYNANGLGIIDYHGDSILVKDVLVGETIKVKIEHKVKEGYYAKVFKLIKSSSWRTKVSCPYFARCGSCDYLYLLYAYELKNKQEDVLNLIKRSGLKIKCNEVVGMDKPIAYRNKCIITFKTDKELIAGFYAANSHQVININHCELHDDKTNELIKIIKQVVKKCRLDIYDENTNRGFLKHVLIRRGFNTDQTLITLVTSTKEFRGKKNFIEQLTKATKSIGGIVQNVNSRRTSIVLGDEEIRLYGSPYIYDELLGLKFKISSKSFYQINHEQCEKLYTKALELAEINSNDVVVDTYCGIGTISLLAAKQAKKVYAVEINRDAIKDAKNNAEINQIDNVEFTNADAGQYMIGLAQRHTKIDVVIMDPAREGSDDAFIDALKRLKPKKIVYISCNPETQMRDLNKLKDTYRFKEVFPFDMFPRTKHVETVVLMSRVDKK